MALAQQNELRDMVDKQLLLSRAKELGFNVDADVVRQLDEIRKQNKFESMEDLEKAARTSGVNFEDFKAGLRDQILTQKVVSEEVGRRLQLNQAEELKYYNDHKSEFNQPEQIGLSEILVPLPETASAAEISAAEAKANDLKSKIMQGGSFADIAKKYSGGPSAAQGGELGMFKQGGLAKVLEDQTYPLKVGESTQPIRTRQGFVILKVTAHDQAGPAPISAVEPQIQEALYMNAMQPALRAYLAKLREESYVDIQPGFVDSGATTKESKPVFTAYAPPVVKKKKPKVQASFGRNGSRPVVSSPDTTGGRTLTGAEGRAAVASPDAPVVDPSTGLAVIAPPPSAVGSKAPTRNTAAFKAPKPLKKEKIRFGQAPRTALQGSDELPPAQAAVPSTVPATEVAANTNLDDNVLAPKAPVKEKTRFAARSEEHKEKAAKVLNAKQLEKVNSKAQPMTAEEATAAKVRSAPLGLGGDTSKKPAKVKPEPGAGKERLEDKKPVEAAPAKPVDNTVDPSLAPTAPTAVPTETPGPRPASATPNDTTLPTTAQPTPGTLPH